MDGTNGCVRKLHGRDKLRYCEVNNVKTKITIVFIAIFSAVLFVAVVNKRDSRVTPDIALSSFLKNEPRKETQAEIVLTEVMAAMQKITPEDGSIPRPGWRRPENVQNLHEIVEKYPNTESALTASLLIGHVNGDIDNPRRDPAKAKAIYSDIKNNFPETWQAVTAEAYEGSLYCAQGQWWNAIPYLENSVDKIATFEENPCKEYAQYRDFVHNGRIYDMRGPLLDALVCAYCKIGDLRKARKACEHLVKQYPDYPRIEVAKRDLRKLQTGVSPYYTPPKKTKEEIAEEIRKIDEE